MVRQVFSQRVFGPRFGRPVDEDEIRAGMIAARRVLGALEALAAEDAFLVGPELSLADLHLAPMLACFAAAPEGRAALSDHPKLAAWWRSIENRASLRTSDPGLPGPINDPA